MLIQRSTIFELSAVVTLNIVCFSVKGDTTGGINREIVMDLHESGVAAPSTTKIGGRPVIRAAIVNHPDAMRDMETFVAAAEACAARVMAERAGAGCALKASDQCDYCDRLSSTSAFMY